MSTSPQPSPDHAFLAGSAIRRLRRREGLTQIAMAQRMGISSSYLNLVERNQRPLSARLVVLLAENFDFDPRSLRRDEAVGGVDGLRRRLADERFADLAIDRDEIAEWLSAAPQAAVAFARLFDAERSVASPASGDIMGLVRHEIERWRNHYADLDAAAEGVADELRLSSADVAAGLAERLRSRHQIAVRILPGEVMPDALRRLDLHARQLQLSEMLDGSSRAFHIAVQLALLEQRDAITAIADGAQFSDRAAWRLYRRHLASYFAAAILMPYGRFLRACEQTLYDFPVLMRRFGVSCEQLAHRLTTLQRVGQRGLPFFMARIDRAGQFSKRHTGASGTMLLDGETSCPLWIAHSAFERPGCFLTQWVDVEDMSGATSQWLTIVRTVEGSGASESWSDVRGDSGKVAMGARFTVVLGVEARFAGQMAVARDRGDQSVRIGLGCARCHRADCLQRSAPPRGSTLHFDERSRGLTPFDFKG